MADVNILLLNAGSSSLKCTLVEAVSRKEIARGLADWAGSVTHYLYAGPDGREQSEEVSWNGHAEAVRRVLHDLMRTEPVALHEKSNLAAVGHRVDVSATPAATQPQSWSCYFSPASIARADESSSFFCASTFR